MDYEELSRTIVKEFANELGRNVPAEVDAKLRLGRSMGFGEVMIVTTSVGVFLVSLVQLAIQFNETNKTPSQIISELQEKAEPALADLQAKTASAVQFTEETLHKIIKRIEQLLTQSK